MEEAGVSSEAVAEYLPRVKGFARSFNGHGGAEFDDLVQEGLERVFLLLRDGKPVTNTAIKNRMRNWVRFCYRRGVGNADTMTEEELDDTSGVHSSPGRRKALDGTWTTLGYAPEPS